MKTQELKRATHAWQKVKRYFRDEKRSKEWRDKYASYALKSSRYNSELRFGPGCCHPVGCIKKADNTSDYDPHFQLIRI